MTMFETATVEELKCIEQLLDARVLDTSDLDILTLWVSKTGYTHSYSFDTPAEIINWLEDKERV